VSTKIGVGKNVLSIILWRAEIARAVEKSLSGLRQVVSEEHGILAGMDLVEL
jgi:hypothetical protein